MDELGLGTSSAPLVIPTSKPREWSDADSMRMYQDLYLKEKKKVQKLKHYVDVLITHVQDSDNDDEEITFKIVNAMKNQITQI